MDDDAKVVIRKEGEEHEEEDLTVTKNQPLDGKSNNERIKELKQKKKK